MNTRTKMFCACDNDAFGKPPNTTICPICSGQPGTLPVLNGEAINKAVCAAYALKCELQRENHLDRKNYFYPDLPMGYQISQYNFPLSKNGVVSFGGGKICRITRLHVENDAGKLIHVGGCSYCDFNRAGTPLMEIVTEPDLRSSKDAVAFAKELQRILITVDASEADMYKGMMRFDASISLRPNGEKRLYPRSEIKNLNSFKSLERALQFEEKRLQKLWEDGRPQEGEVTVHWDDDRGVGTILREKESAADYRYFPEPDLPPLHFDEVLLKEAADSVGELPTEKKKRYIATGLDEAQAQLLTGDPKLATFYDAIAAHTGDHKRAASLVLTQLMGFLRAAEKELADGPSTEEVLELLTYVDNGTISANAAKEVLEKMIKSGNTAARIIEEENLRQITDEGELEEMVKQALAATPKAAEDMLAGKGKAAGAVIGFVMQRTRGQANPKTVQDILQRLVQGM